jgi:sensor histidine kinase regulating citrate/malate metabolism
MRLNIDRLKEHRKLYLNRTSMNGMITLTCQDNGIGIDLDKHGANFGLNKTFHDHPDAKGTGLFITKIKSNNGIIIYAESKVDQGTNLLSTSMSIIL